MNTSQVPQNRSSPAKRIHLRARREEEELGSCKKPIYTHRPQLAPDLSDWLCSKTSNRNERDNNTWPWNYMSPVRGWDEARDPKSDDDNFDDILLLVIAKRLEISTLFERSPGLRGIVGREICWKFEVAIGKYSFAYWLSLLLHREKWCEKEFFFFFFKDSQPLDWSYRFLRN